MLGPIEERALSTWELLARAEEQLGRAERIVVGIGSGLSAAGGLNYGDPALVERWYPEYAALGFRSIVELQGLYWDLGSCDLRKYWGFWARHILHIRYETPATPPYLDLKRLLDGRDCFVITTNVDSQAEKAGFPPERSFAPQGNYAWFQCSGPCCGELTPNEEPVRRMVERMPDAFSIREEDVPRCPRCGAPLMPNLRCDERFVEGPHLQSLPAYEGYLAECREREAVFLELGVGFNTPGIIRFPFEALTARLPRARLIRINAARAGAPRELADRAIPLQADLAQALRGLAALRSGGGAAPV